MLEDATRRPFDSDKGRIKPRKRPIIGTTNPAVALMAVAGIVLALVLLVVLTSG